MKVSLTEFIKTYLKIKRYEGVSHELSICILVARVWQRLGYATANQYGFFRTTER
ncbi:hypothetical protein Noda2021_00980 [Candidatus Dependentiae bacterium Noda2021]|nr:hypothetical protein Noda2021_00980 [Candidatus Dependentiae bacterium Noda2021]